MQTGLILSVKDFEAEAVFSKAVTIQVRCENGSDENMDFFKIRFDGLLSEVFS